jgi:hypothetical protein
VKSEQEQVWSTLGEQKQTIESHEEKFEKEVRISIFRYKYFLIL